MRGVICGLSGGGLILGPGACAGDHSCASGGFLLVSRLASGFLVAREAQVSPRSLGALCVRGRFVSQRLYVTFEYSFWGVSFGACCSYFKSRASQAVKRRACLSGAGARGVTCFLRPRDPLSVLII